MTQIESYRVLPVVGMLISAAITPGPNNLVVLQASARGGWAAAGRIVLGVNLGAVSLLAVVAVGLSRAMGERPVVAALLSIAGGLYLAWLGVSLFVRAGHSGAEDSGRGAPSSVLGVAAFQWVNPKAWMLVVTAFAALAGAGGVVMLAILMVVVSGACLGLWAWAGALSSRFLDQRRAWAWIDRGMGVLLVVSAAGVIADVLIDRVFP